MSGKTFTFNPQSLSDLRGQDETRDNLRTMIAAYRKTGQPLRHMLFLGGKGLGKTTLARVLTKELGVRFHKITGGDLKTQGDLKKVLLSLQEGDILFIDEIHTLLLSVQRRMLTSLLDFEYTEVDKDGSALTHKLPRFTCIGATTHVGLLDGPFIERFKEINLRPYSLSELTEMAQFSCYQMRGFDLDESVAVAIAQIARGSARHANDMLRDIIYKAEGCFPNEELRSVHLNHAMLLETLRSDGRDPYLGLNMRCRKALVHLLWQSKPMGLERLAADINESAKTVENEVEPQLTARVNLPGTEERGALLERQPSRVATTLAAHYILLCQKLQDKGWFKGEDLEIPVARRREAERISLDQVDRKEKEYASR